MSSEDLERLGPKAQLWRDFDLDQASLDEAIRLVRTWADTDEDLALHLVNMDFVRQGRDPHEFIRRVRALMN